MKCCLMVVMAGMVMVGLAAKGAVFADAGLPGLMAEGVFAKERVERCVEELLATRNPSGPWFLGLGEYCRWQHATPALRRAAIDRMVEVAKAQEENGGKRPLGALPLFLYQLKSLEYLTGDAHWGTVYRDSKADWFSALEAGDEADAKVLSLGDKADVPVSVACAQALARLVEMEELPADAERFRTGLKRYAAILAPRLKNHATYANELAVALRRQEAGPRGATSRAIAAGYAGKTAVLTGAASGMGRCSAETLAEAGATVLICDIDVAGAKRVADAINARGQGKAYAVECDVRKFADAEKAAALAIEKTGRIDLMVHWAGGYEPRMRNTNGVPFYEQPLEVLDWGIDVNLKGAVYFARACMPQMVKQKSGVLVCIGSVTGFEGDGCGAMYGTAKSGLYNFIKGLAKAGAPHGIRAFSVTPGPVMTRPGMARMKTVLDRPSQPQELVDFVLYLASESCPSVTGTNHVMDAGRLCLP